MFCSFQPITNKQINNAGPWLKSSVFGRTLSIFWLWYVLDKMEQSWGTVRNGTRHKLICNKTKQFKEGLKTLICTYPGKRDSGASADCAAIWRDAGLGTTTWTCQGVTFPAQTQHLSGTEEENTHPKGGQGDPSPCNPVCWNVAVLSLAWASPACLEKQEDL